MKMIRDSKKNIQSYQVGIALGAYVTLGKVQAAAAGIWQQGCEYDVLLNNKCIQKGTIENCKL